MADYFLAPALAKLRAWQGPAGEVQLRWPGRDTTSDGWLGDPSHQSRVSDHNPDWDAPPPSTGIVRALDLDIDGWPAIEVRNHIIARCRSGAERRVAYIISDRTIWSVTHGWQPLRYDGENPHTQHIHFSLRHDASNFDTSLWLAKFGEPPPDDEDDDHTPLPDEEEDEMARQITVLGDAEPDAVYLVSGVTVQHVPNREWQTIYGRTGLVDLGRPVEEINMVQFEWVMKEVLEAGGSVGCPLNEGLCMFSTGKRYVTWADASNDRAKIAELTALVSELDDGEDD